MAAFEALVVGAGIIGATTAAMLAERGIQVALVEGAAAASSGGTAYSGGIVRLYDADPVMMGLGAHALHLRRHHPVGRLFDRAIKKSGVLYRAAQSEAPAIGAGLAELARHIPAEAMPQLLSRRELGSVTGFVAPCPRRVDVFEPEGGHSDVRFATHSMVNLVRMGARRPAVVLEHMPVTAIRSEGRGPCEVTLAGGMVLKADIVVVAAGPWARALCGAQVEARSVPLGLLATPQAPALPVIDTTVGSYAVPFGPGMIGIGCGPRHSAARPEDLPKGGAAQRADALAKLAALSDGRAGGEVVGVFDGLDSYTPDARPLLGFAAGDRALFMLTGMAGLGFKIAPALADLAACRIAAALGHRQGQHGFEADSLAVLSAALNPDRFAPRPAAGPPPPSAPKRTFA